MPVDIEYRRKEKDAMPVSLKPVASEFTAKRSPRDYTRIAFVNDEGLDIDIGPKTGYGDTIRDWLNNGGLADILALASKADDGVAAKLAAIGKAGKYVRLDQSSDTREWRVVAHDYRTSPCPTISEAVDEALAHFGLAAEPSPPAAPAPEAGLTAEEVERLRCFLCGAIPLWDKGERVFFTSLDQAATLCRLAMDHKASQVAPLADDEINRLREALNTDHANRVNEVSPFLASETDHDALIEMIVEHQDRATQATEAGPALTTQEKLLAIAARLNASTVGAVLWTPTGEYRVEVKDRCDDRHFGPDAETYDEAVNRAYAQFLPAATPTPEESRR